MPSFFWGGEGFVSPRDMCGTMSCSWYLFVRDMQAKDLGSSPSCSPSFEYGSWNIIVVAAVYDIVWRREASEKKVESVVQELIEKRGWV